MATVNKNFKIKQGLIVEGSTATVNGNQVLTENASDQYIINLIGGETLVTSVNSGQLQVINGELSVKANVFDSYGSAADAETNANSYTDGEISTALTTAQGYANTAESNANSYTNTALNDYTTTANLDTTIDGYGYLKSADLSGYATETYADNAASGAQSAAETFATNAINALDTDDIEEGVSNQYYTDTRARGAVSAGDGLNYDSNTGAFTAHLGNGLEISGGAIRIDDSVVATETDLTNAITAHDVTTGVHGLAGDVVGTTDTQTISNKTLGSDLAAGGFQITNLGAPQNSTDAATKAYVDAVSEGLHVHAAARVAVQGNISIATGLENGDSAGGVTLVTGDRVLVKDQTVASENGIYVVQTSGQALRATDFDTATEVASGDFIFVTEGTYANTGWVQTNNPATIGTDPISFTQFSGAGAFTAGNGLTLNGTEFSINDTITATVTYVDTEIGDHASDTGTHGVTEIVGVSESQTLTNKTLGSSTVLGANLDAANTYTVANLQEPVNNQDAATKFYVDGEISSVTGTIDNLTTTDISEGTNLYFTNQRALDATSAAYDPAGSAATAQSNAEDYADGLAVNYDPAGSASTAQSNAETFATNAINALDTDDIEEGITNQYFTTGRAQSAAADLLTGASLTNITITGSGAGLTITAENGVDDSTTDDLAEGTTNKYYSDSLVDNHLSGGDGITYSAGTISASVGSGLSTATGDIVVDRNTTDTWYDAAGAASTAQTNAETFATNAINALDTDDIEEGATNKYFSDQRAIDAVAGVLTEGSNIDITLGVNSNPITVALSEDVVIPTTGSLEVESNDFNVGSQSVGLRTSDSYTNPMGVFSIDADDDYAQLAIKNTGNGVNSSTDFIAYANNGDDTSGWIDLGITSSTFNDPEFTITAENDGYIFMEAPSGTTGNGDLVIATGSNGAENRIVFAAGGLQSNNTQMTITPDESVRIVIPTASTSPTTGALVVDGGVGIQGDVNIQGTITFGGSGTTVTTDNLAVQEPVIYLADGNTTDNLDTGIVAQYNNSGTKYAGIVRDATDGVFKLFSNATTKPTSTVNFAEAGLAYGDLKVDNIEAASGTFTNINIAGIVDQTEIGYLNGVTSSVQNQLNSKQATLTAGTNIDITSNTISVTGLDTNDVAEGSNLYFTDQRAVDAITNANIYPTMVDINDYRREEAAQQYVATASTVTAHSFTGNWSVKYLARIVGTVSGTLHSQVTELLVTVDGSNNIAITEYGSIYTSEEPLASFTADYSSGSYRLRATTANNGMEVVVAATMLSWAD